MKHKTLEDIKKLADNWNGNGAKAFSSTLIDKCKAIIDNLDTEPYICPTACGSIQLEYEKDDGSYLEFEVYEDSIKVYYDAVKGEARNYSLSGPSAIDRMKQLIFNFCRAN